MTQYTMFKLQALAAVTLMLAIITTGKSWREKVVLSVTLLSVYSWGALLLHVNILYNGQHVKLQHVIKL